MRILQLSHNQWLFAIMLSASIISVGIGYMWQNRLGKNKKISDIIPWYSFWIVMMFWLFIFAIAIYKAINTELTHITFSLDFYI